MGLHLGFSIWVESPRAVTGMVALSEIADRNIASGIVDGQRNLGFIIFSYLSGEDGRSADDRGVHDGVGVVRATAGDIPAIDGTTTLLLPHNGPASQGGQSEKSPARHAHSQLGEMKATPSNGVHLCEVTAIFTGFHAKQSSLIDICTITGTKAVVSD